MNQYESESLQIQQNQGEDDYYDYQDFDSLGRLESVRSYENPYNVYELTQIIDKIYEENLQNSHITSLAPAWNLMLYCFCEFSKEKLIEMIDVDQIGRNIVLRYKQNYVPKKIKGECSVCLSQTVLLSNPCGHSFCYQCWRNHLQLHHTDRNHFQLFPNCQEDGCYHKTNYILMEQLWLIHPEMKASFQSLLCLRYTQKSSRAVLCSSENCNKAILLNQFTQTVVVCKCQNKICKFCRQRDHFPLICGDLKAWSNILQTKQNQWINEIVTQKCPMCKTPIEKNNGCVHMTCICKYEFCWICLKVWKNHNNLYACQEVTRESHEQRLKEEQEKRKKNEGEYSVRFQQSKSQVQRYQNIIKRLKSLGLTQIQEKIKGFYNLHTQVLNELLRFNQIRAYLIQVFTFELNVEIYRFFELPAFKKLKRNLLPLSKIHSELDNYLLQKLKLLQSPLIEKAQEGILKPNQEIQGIIAAIKFDLIEGRDDYTKMFKDVKREYQLLKNSSFALQ